ncbi:hypothetical protein [uncultured Algimonas sp.]|uniref:hypothetical protein n=1 Tax=uncultured Algimonas sp. TaxID=1547920 RepID=UPI002612D86B|nr:hypothetical protein [uncultured Algimonas sp.]
MTDPSRFGRPILLTVFATIAMAACTSTPTNMTRPVLPPFAVEAENAEALLRDFAQAWRGSREFPLEEAVTLGLWIDGEGHTIRLSDQGGSHAPGAPEDFDWGFETDGETLRRLHQRSLNALTAMGQARADDPTPLTPRTPPDFADADRVRSFYIPLTLHFWNRAWPETIPFGDGATREIHGANTSVLIYDTGLRSAWYQLKPGMHINADPKDQVNEFDTAIIVTRGRFGGKLDGVARDFREGETVLVPKGMTHEFFATENQYGEFLILMYGNGA